jgi:hypothetical protein
VAQEAQRAGTVEPRRLDQLVGYGEEELASLE